MNAIPKIMVVDDEASICNNVEKILKKSNYAVTRASSAKEALDMLAKESFSLLISDIVMPEMNGLELLKMVKKEWPVTRAVMMTAYASTDTAVKAIRMGALEYLPKPFTPDELRATVENALSGRLVEARISEQERESINIIDVDIPFDTDEVAKVTGKGYADSLGPSDMPVVEVKMPENLEGFCEVGNMVCDIFKKLGATCKAGTKTAACPQLAKKKKSAKGKTVDTKRLIGIDQPFDYEEVAAVSGPEYIQNLRSDGVSIPYYEELKANLVRLAERNKIDVDVPFDADEVAQVTGKAYVDHATRTDVPTVEITASESVEGFCEVGDMVCDIFKKLGATCKAGTKTAACPQLAKKKRAAMKKAVADTTALIAPDMPFNYDEVVQVTGKDYVDHLVYDGTVQMPYETLKSNMQKIIAAETQDPASRQIAQVPAHPSILVVDDEVAVNNNIRKILAKKGYQVDQAVTREEAMDCIGTNRYGLVLLDLRIPGVKGLELLKAIGEKNPDAKVIMITGYASIETAVEAARMGAVDYLPKPFTPDEIRNATERALPLAA
ncbi:response regulator [Desulfosarcina sp.]|uniref:response regulator n=1 Tax=Desulfosarcina sp. TaxID=2027861 RepID=UPI003562A9C8